MQPLAERPAPERVLGSSVPRLFPVPLPGRRIGEGENHGCPCGCALSPVTSYGFDVIEFAALVLRTPLDEWQQFMVIHGGELRADGSPRFKRLLIIVARQNGKTFLLKVLTLFWLFVEGWPIILGQSTTVSLAREVWDSAQEMARAVPALDAEFGKVRRDNNDPHWRVAGGARYKIAAATSKGGRSLSVDRLVMDELREHRTWEAYNASIPTMNARPFGQGWLITNQGDERSVVLVDLRATGVSNIEALEAGQEEIDEELGLYEWSSPPGAEPTEELALAAANPGMNRSSHGPTSRSLLSQARAALERGGEALTGFRTELMCHFVPALDAAVDPEGWARGEEFGTLEGLRSRIALVPEISPDMLHASLLAAAMLPDGRVRVEVLASWSGPGCSKALRQDLPIWARKVRPRVLAWLPNGPTASITAELTGDDVAMARKYGLRPEQMQEIRGEVSAVCMGFAEMVRAGEVVHCGQDLLSKQVLGSAKLWIGDVWRFSRQGDGHCDAAYGAAAAVHIARTMPPPAGPPKLVVAR
jgi:hypothetical protein